MSSAVTPDHIRAILHHHDPALELRHARRPVGGIANDTYLVDTNLASLVLKRYDDVMARWKPRKEQAVFAHLRQHGIPAPEMVAFDPSCQVVPFAWSLTRRVRGTPWSDLASTLDHDTQVHLYRQFGDLVGRMHSATFAAFGDFTSHHGRLVVDAAHHSRPLPSESSRDPMSTGWTCTATSSPPGCASFRARCSRNSLRR